MTASIDSPRRHAFIAILSAASGNLVEYYDFFVYSYTAIYFAAAFFPADDPTTPLLKSAAVFAAGFIARPIGAYVFGYIADRHGRRRSLMISVLLMCAGAFMIAVLPTHKTIGAAAPVLLFVARFLQGVSIGGEYGAAATYMSEAGTKGRRGFFASFQMITIIAGQLLALLVVGALQAIMREETMRAWGWRIPFFIGALAAAVALLLRGSLPETPSFGALRQERENAASMRELSRRHGRAMIVVFTVTAGGTFYYYVFASYMQKYLVNTAGMNARTASTVMTVVLFFIMLLQPVFGAIGDRIGTRNSLRCFALLGVIAAGGLFRALGRVTSFYSAFALVFVALVISSFYNSISGLLKAELFPTKVRALGISMPYAAANVFFAGSAEFVALKLKSMGHEGWFSWYVTFMLLVVLITSLVMPDTRKLKHLDRDEGT